MERRAFIHALGAAAAGGLLAPSLPPSAKRLKRIGLELYAVRHAMARDPVPYDVFIERLDPAVVRLQLDVGNMLMGGGDPMRYLEKHRERYWSFHLKDVLPDRSSDTELGRGVFDFKRFLAAVPAIDDKPCYVEQEGASDELAAARSNFQYLRELDF